MKNLNFRAWHKELKEMENVLLMCFVNEYVEVLPFRNLEGGSQEAWSFKDIILMQSTGLKDSKEVEIFEGDIVLITCDYEDEIDYLRPGVWEVNLKQGPYGGFYFGLKHIEGLDSIYGTFEPDNWIIHRILKNNIIEIIGNIHEQPELLGGGV